jgi:hypothetical protein
VVVALLETDAATFQGSEFDEASFNGDQSRVFKNTFWEICLISLLAV